MGSSLNSNVSSSRLVFTQEDFSGGINNVDQTMTMKDNCVKFAKNFDLTVENRLQKRKGLIYQFDRAWRTNFEKTHQELGSIVRPIEGTVQAYHSFTKVDGSTVEFWVINGKIYQYPFIFANAVNGVRYDIYDTENTLVDFELTHRNKFDILTTQNQVIFLTGEQILEYAPYTDESGVASDTVYQLQYIKPYRPLLEEFTNIKYGQNNLVSSKLQREHWLNVQLLGKTGFLGLMTTPNILYPSVKPFDVVPIINQTGLGQDAVMATQIVTRVIGGSSTDTSVANKNKLNTTERFAVPAAWDDNSGTSVEMPITSTNQLEVLGTTFNVQGTSLSHLTINPDTTKTMVAFNATNNNNLAVFKNADGGFDFYSSTIVDDVLAPNADKLVLTWGADQNIAEIKQVKTNQAGSIIVSFTRTDKTEQTELLVSKGFGLRNMEWDSTHAFGFTSKTEWKSNVPLINSTSTIIRTNKDATWQTTVASNAKESNPSSNANALSYSCDVLNVGYRMLYNRQYLSNYGNYSLHAQGSPPSSPGYGAKYIGADINSHKLDPQFNADGSFRVTLKLEWDYGWQFDDGGEWHDTVRGADGVAKPAPAFRVDPTNPNSDTTTITHVAKDADAFPYRSYAAPWTTISGLKDALDAGVYGFTTKECVLYDNNPLLRPLDGSSYLIALYNSDSTSGQTQILDADRHHEFIYWAKINIYNLLSDPVIINDKYAALSFAYLDEGNVCYTEKEGRVWQYTIDGNVNTLMYEDSRLPFNLVVENSAHSIIAIHNTEQNGALYRIDNTNWDQPIVLWVDDPILAINKSVTTAGSFVYITPYQIKRTANWKQAYGLDFKFASGDYTVVSAWETTMNNYSFIIVDNTTNIRYYATSSIQAPTYPTKRAVTEDPADHIVGDNITKFVDLLNDHKDYLIDWIQFAKKEATDRNTIFGVDADPGVTLSIQGKFPDYDDFVELFTVDFNDGQYHPEFQYLMYEFDEIKVILKERDENTPDKITDIFLTIGTVSSPEDTTSQLSKYETVWVPQLTPVNESQNVNYIHECTRGYYKNGYLMIYGANPNNLANPGNTIFISDINRPNYFPQFNTIDISTEGAESIQKIASWNSQLENVVFMENSIYYLKFSSPTEVELRIITNSIGLSAPDSVANAANKLFFVSYKGVYALTNTSFATDGNANYALINEKVAPLMYNDEGIIDDDSIGYIQDNNYYLIVPNVLDYDIHETPISVFRRFKYYTSAGKQCWYMDESPYFDISKVYQRQGRISYIMYGVANVLQDYKEEYVDGDLDGYTDCIPDSIDPNTVITYPDDPTFYIYGAEMQTKGYATDYRKHTKNFRKALVEIGLGKQNVNLGIGSEIDGYTKLDPTEVTSVYRDGQFHLEKTIVPNFVVNAGTFVGTLKEKGTFVWNVAKWGWKKSLLSMASSYKRGLTMSIIIKQVANEATPYQIITVGFEYRVRNLRKQS